MPIPSIPPGAPSSRTDAFGSQVLSGTKTITLSSSPKITICGDSQVKNNILVGYGIAPVTPILGISDVANLFFERGFPTGNATVTWDFPNKRINVAANGETVGAWVDISLGGVFDVASSGGKKMRIYCCKSKYVSSVTTTANVTGNIFHEYTSGHPAGMLDALTGHRFVFADPLMGVPGDKTTDVYARRQQIADQGSAVIWNINATNDVAGDIATATILASELATYQFFNALGRIYISTAIFPRFEQGLGDGSYTATREHTINAYNAALYALARQYPNWHVVDADAASDSANLSKAKVGYTSDGLHAKGAMFLLACRQVADILDFYYPKFRGSPRLVGPGALYHSTENPKGNLINNSAGSFIGTGGTAGTGITAAAAWITLTAYSVEDFVISGGKAYRCVSAGTTSASAPIHTSGVATDGTAQWQFICSGATVGIPANWSFQRSVGSTAVGKGFKISDSTGDWFALHITAAADDEIVYGYTDQESYTNFITGDEIDAGIDFEVIGNGCAGVKMDMNPDGAMTTASAISANQMDGVVSGVTGKSSVYIPPSLKWISTSVTGCRFRAYTRTQAGCAYLWKLSNAVIRKV